MKRLGWFLLFLFVIVPFQVRAQKWKLKRYEAIAGIGTSNYFGDIGGSADENNLLGLKDIDLKSTKPSFSAGIRYRITSLWSAKLGLTYAWLSGDDQGSRNEARGFSYSTTLFEPSVQVEYSIIPEERRHSSTAWFNKRGMLNNYSRVNLYIFAGLGGAFFGVKPDSVLAENYDEEHKTTGMVIPAGVGLKYVIDDLWSVGFELGGRLTTTDYLDGYTSEWSNTNDIYYFGIINAIYKIRTTRKGIPYFFQGRRNRMGFF